MIREIVFGAMLSVALLAGCKRDPDCGGMLEYDRASRRCVCPGVFVCVTPDDCQCLPADGGTVDSGPERRGDAAIDAPSCAESEVTCGATCVDTSSDALHCGGCNVECLPGETCRESICEDPVVELAAGSAHACALRGSGAIWCWGFGMDGQLGNGMRSTSLVPVRVAVIDDAIAIASTSELSFSSDASTYTCALRRNGTVWCWGKNEFGQLGGSLTSSDVPRQVSGIAGALAIGTGSQFACAVLADRTVLCWGGSETDVVAPRAVPSASGVEELAGGLLMMARDVANRVSWWDGLGADATHDEWPAVHPARAVAAGISGACALDGGGTPFCIGVPESVGVVGGESVLFPTEVAGAGTGFTAIAAGTEDVCAIDGMGVLCWGRRDLGVWARDARVEAAVPPVRVHGTRGATEIVVGAFYACALIDDRPHCWGGSAHGELGRGSTLGSDVPLPVLGLFD